MEENLKEVIDNYDFSRVFLSKPVDEFLSLIPNAIKEYDDLSEHATVDTIAFHVVKAVHAYHDLRPYSSKFLINALINNDLNTFNSFMQGYYDIFLDIEEMLFSDDKYTFIPMQVEAFDKEGVHTLTIKLKGD